MRISYWSSDVCSSDLQTLVSQYKAIVEDELGHPFPQDVNEQLWGAIRAVFDSWDSDRAKVYRRLNDIPGDWGTAVNVQAMVFGNMGDTRSEEHTSELQSLMRISYAVLSLKNKTTLTKLD